MRSFSVAGIAAVAFGLAGVCSAVDTSVPGWDGALQKEGWTCIKTPRRLATGRSVSFGNTVCPGQISTCEALCKSRGGVVEGENACVSNNGGTDNPFKSNTYCFVCNCEDGALPDLETYHDTVPRYRCELRSQNCFYGYSQGGQLPPDGACRCPEAEYAVPPSWYSLLPKTTSTVLPPSSISTSVGQTLTSAVETSAAQTTTSEPATVTDTVVQITSTELTTLATTTTATSEETSVAIETTSSILSNETATVPTQQPVATGGSTKPVVGVMGAMVAALLAM